MRTFAKVFHNTNLSNTIRSNKTILFNKPVSLKLNIKHSTTLTRSCIRCIKIKYKVIKLHTTHSLPSPLNSSNIYYTSTTLTFSQKCQRKPIIVHTISISKNIVNFLWFRKHKMSNGFFIRITTVIIISTRYFSKFVHNTLI